MIEQMISGTRKFLSTFFFLGYIPGAPGTYASIATILILWFSRDVSSLWLGVERAPQFLFFYILFILVATWLSNDAKDNFGVADPGPIVIDEVVGQLIVFLFVPITFATLIIGFALFRFFDIVKPWPIHKFEEMDEGLGIMMDEVVAGIAAGISLHGIVIIYNAIISYLS